MNKDLQKEYERLIRLQTENDVKLEQTKKELAELGIKTKKDAEAELAKLDKEIAKLQKEIEDGTTKLEESLAELED